MNEESELKQHRPPRYQYLRRNRHTALRLRHIQVRQTMLTNSLAQHRLQQNLTQEALARMCGLSRKTINAIETCQREPRLSAALLVAQALDHPIEKLFKLR